MANRNATTPRRLADDLLVIHSDRHWELIEEAPTEPPKATPENTRAFVLEKLESIAATAAHNPLTGEKIHTEEEEEDDENEALPACPVAVVVNEAVADSAYVNSWPTPEVVEQLHLFRRQQNRVTVFVLGAVCCAGLATVGGLVLTLA